MYIEWQGSGLLVTTDQPLSISSYWGHVMRLASLTFSAFSLARSDLFSWMQVSSGALAGSYTVWTPDQFCGLLQSERSGRRPLRGTWSMIQWNGQSMHHIMENFVNQRAANPPLHSLTPNTPFAPAHVPGRVPSLQMSSLYTPNNQRPSGLRTPGPTREKPAILVYAPQ